MINLSKIFIFDIFLLLINVLIISELNWQISIINIINKKKFWLKLVFQGHFQAKIIKAFLIVQIIDLKKIKFKN